MVFRKARMMGYVRKAVGLVEAAAFLGVVAISIVGLGLYQRDASEMARVNAAATHLAQVRDAAQEYLRVRRVELESALPVGGAPVVVPVGRTSETGTPPANSLQALGFLPPAFVNANPYGHELVVLVRRPQQGRLEALVVQTGGRPVSDRNAMLLARRVGADGAVIRQSGANAQGEGAGRVARFDPAGWNTSGVTFAAGRVVAHAVWTERHAVADALAAPSGNVDSNRMYTDIDLNQNRLRQVGTADSHLSIADLYRLARTVTVGTPCDLEREVAIADGDLVTCWGGVWRARSVIGETAPPQNCSASMVSWSQGAAVCSGNAAAANHGQSVTVTSTNGIGTGTAVFQCNNGAWSQTSGSCSGTASCPTQTVSWSGSTSGCSGSATATAHGGTRTVSNTASGRSGSATFQCNNGNWQVQGGATCTAACPAQTVSWNGAASGCSGSIGSGSQGQSTTVSNTASGRTGSATFQCTASGSWQYMSGSCTSAPPNCPHSYPSSTMTCTCTASAIQEAGGFAGWGDMIYTNDSPICAAAVHAGRIGWSGGVVTVVPTAGQCGYAGTTRNGMTTSSWGCWDGSFYFQ